MIGQQYKAHKENVIDLFNGYKVKRGNLNDGVDLKFLEDRIANLKDNKFILAIAGEVKAGKSTFINALLGAEILPTDVLQASSAIVEIFKSEKSYLKIKYADGKTEEIRDDLSTPDIDEAKSCLHKICSISDEYRGIPITIIDDYIVNNRSNNIKVDDSFLKRLEFESGEELEEKKERIQKYISERTWNKIPVEIQYGYPLKWKFDELRIVDSPGVNATGGVQNVSFNFFEDANAVLFIHKISPVESESFKKFVEKTITNRSKETLFLVLTHAGPQTDSDVERLHKEAIRLYKSYIPEERILAVDSLLQIIYNDLVSGKSLQEIEDSSEEKSDILSKFEKKAKKTGKELSEILAQFSRFENMFEAIDKFSMLAPNIQLKEILDSIKAGYEDQDSQFSDRLVRLNQKKKNPQEYEMEIIRIKNALNEYKLSTNRTKEEINETYTGKESKWEIDIEKLKGKYPELITKADNFPHVRKYLTDALNELEDSLNNFSGNLSKDLNRKLEEAGKTFKEKHNVTIPKIDLKSIEENTKKVAFKPKYREETEGIFANWNIFKFNWSKASRTYKVQDGVEYDKEKHLKSFKQDCNESFYEIVATLSAKTKDILGNFLNSFALEMSNVIQERQNALDEENKKIQENEEIIKMIKETEVKKKLLPKELKRVEEILEDIK